MSVEPKKRRGRGMAQGSMDIIQAAAEILSEIQPASVRAVCYRLFSAGLIDNMKKTNTNKVSRLLTKAREDGLIPWEHIVDETREAEIVNSWDNPEALIQAAVSQYRKDYWQDQPRRVEVWSEKGTIRGTLAPILKKYGVTFRVMHGYGSSTSVNNIAEANRGDDKPLTALYVGDWDPSGLHMSEIDLPGRLDRYGGILTMNRIALSAEDVAPGTDIPSFQAETKASDPRHKWFIKQYGDLCWELDALSPVILRTRVENHIIDLLDVPAWNHAVEIERAETTSMQSFLKDWRSNLRQASKYSGSL